MYYPGYLGKRFLTTPLQALVFLVSSLLHLTQHSLHLVGIQVEIPIGDLSTRQDEVQAQVNVRNQKIQLAEARQTVKKS